MGILTSAQRRNARAIIAETKRIGMRQGWGFWHTRHVARMALMCSLQEADLFNYANANVPRSLHIPADATGYDHDSVGLFQQRVGIDGNGAGWGTVDQAMNPYHATWAFVRRLIDLRLDGTPPNAWEMGRAIQRVQVSAFPDAYETHFGFALRILNIHYRTTRPAPNDADGLGGH